MILIILASHIDYWSTMSGSLCTVCLNPESKYCTVMHTWFYIISWNTVHYNVWTYHFNVIYYPRFFYYTWFIYVSKVRDWGNHKKKYTVHDALYSKLVDTHLQSYIIRQKNKIKSYILKIYILWTLYMLFKERCWDVVDYAQ